jgi:hypothetical protein
MTRTTLERMGLGLAGAVILFHAATDWRSRGAVYVPLALGAGVLCVYAAVTGRWKRRCE